MKSRARRPTGLKRAAIMLDRKKTLLEKWQETTMQPNYRFMNPQKNLDFK